MPYLWATVEKQKPQPELCKRQSELQVLEKKKFDLLKDEKYEELIEVRDEIKCVKDKIIAIEEAEKQSKNITVDTVFNWLHATSNSEEKEDTKPQDGNCSKAKACFISNKIKRFQEQLLEDYDLFYNHTQKRYFADNCCRVSHEIEVKLDANVMLLHNLNVGDKLANGSRGVILAMIDVKDCYFLLENELSECEKHYEAARKSKPAQNENDETTVLKNANNIRQILNIDPKTLEEMQKHIATMDCENIKRELICIEKGTLSNLTQLPHVRFTEGQKRLLVPQPF